MKYTLLFILLIVSWLTGFGQIISDTAITSTDSVIHIYGVIKKPIVNQNNIAPTVNAGADKSITLPISTVQLVGTASDADGNITKYLWQKASGTGGTISTPNTATTNITGLTAGTYVYSLTVIDNSGATASDNVMVLVNAAPPNNQSPTANAGTDKQLILPNNSIDIQGSGTDADGTVVAYTWTKITGPSTFTLTNSNTAKVTVSNLVAGTYVFRLTVTDNQGASGTDDVSVTVSQLTPPPIFNIEGYGSSATGGAGFQTIHITNLSQLASNIGSNRILLIDVSGTINTGINITNVSNLTIDAYSTKQDVTITNNSTDGLTVENSTNVIITGLRSINNGGGNSDGFNAVGSSSNVVFDHCSAYGNTDGNIDLTATSGKNFSVQWCIMGNDKQSGNQLITTMNASAHHNLYVGDGAGEGAERNPFAHANYSPKGSQSNPNFDFRNNLVNASGRYASGDGYGAVGNFVNNYYTSNKAGLINLCSDAGNCGSGYVSGNFNQPNSTGGTRLSSECTIPTQYKVTTTDAVTAAQSILQNVGCYKKTSYEQGVINSITISGTPIPQSCTGFIYSDWSSCVNGQQTRTVTGFSPTNCTGQPSGQPVLTQSCSSGGGDTTTGNYPGYSLVRSIPFDKASDITSNQLGRGGFSTFGGGSFRSEVRAGDAPISSGWRSEQQYGNAETPTEGIWEWDWYGENWGNFDGGGHSVQMHPYTGGASANISLQNFSNKFDVVRAIGSTVTHQSGTLKNCAANTWYHLRLESKMSTGNDGYIRFFVDGVQTYSYTGRVDDGSGQYFKLGQNRWPDGNGNSMQTTSVCYYKNLKIYKKNS